MIYIKIVKAKYVSDYKIWFLFSDLSEREIDFKDFLHKTTHPSIRKYLEINLFKKFKIIDGDIDWNDFDMCFPVHDLYMDNLKSEEKQSA